MNRREDKPAVVKTTTNTFEGEVSLLFVLCQSKVSFQDTIRSIKSNGEVISTLVYFNVLRFCLIVS